MNIWLLLITACSTFALDRVTKYWAFNALSHESITVFPGFNFILSWNKGVSWNFLTPDTTLGFWLLTGFIVALITGLAVMFFKHVQQKMASIFETMLLAGALSNLFDRFYYGAVLDFIQWHVKDWYWPTFNVADAAIVCGVVGIVLKNWRE